MHAEACATVEPGPRLRQLVSAPPLTLRRVRSDDPSVCALCLVGTAAGPLGGDDLRLSLDVRGGARATFGATGASIAQGRGRSALTIAAAVADGAALRADPGALVVCAGAWVDVRLELTLGQDADVVWRELLVLGRTGEPRGAATLQWDVVRGGKPLLRQQIDLTDPAVSGWSGMLLGQRVMLSELRVGPGVRAATVVHGPTAVTHRLTEQATLTTVLASDAHEAVRQLSICHR